MSSPAASEPAAPPSHHHITRPLDAMAVAIIVLLSLSWGMTQIAVKLALHDIPPLTQVALRSVIATVLVTAWCLMRKIPLFKRDGTLWPGILAGALFGFEFALINQGLVYTTATRTSVFLYIAPFLVVIGGRVLLPSDRFRLSQWIGLVLSFIGLVVAFGVPVPALDPRQTLGDVLIIVAAVAWAATTLTIKASRALNATSPEKVLLYQLVVSAPLVAIAAWLSGEHLSHWPDGQALGWMAYQSIWVASVTFVMWFALIKKFSASRVSAFIVLTPLFGVAAGYFVMNDPLTPAFLVAVALVAAGLVLVNRAK